MDEKYIELLKQALADETITVRLYSALLAIAPPDKISKILEIIADETDHQAVVADLLLEAVSGQSAEQEQLIPGIE